MAATPDQLCDMCGDVGYAEHLVTCYVCRTSREHMYCIVNKFNGNPLQWTCESCQSKSETQALSSLTTNGSEDDQNNTDIPSAAGPSVQSIATSMIRGSFKKTRNSKIGGTISEVLFIPENLSRQNIHLPNSYKGHVTKNPEKAKVRFLSTEEVAGLASGSRVKASYPGKGSSRLVSPRSSESCMRPTKLSLDDRASNRSFTTATKDAGHSEPFLDSNVKHRDESMHLESSDNQTKRHLLKEISGKESSSREKDTACMDYPPGFSMCPPSDCNREVQTKIPLSKEISGQGSSEREKNTDCMDASPGFSNYPPGGCNLEDQTKIPLLEEISGEGSFSREDTTCMDPPPGFINYPSSGWSREEEESCVDIQLKSSVVWRGSFLIVVSDTVKDVLRGIIGHASGRQINIKAFKTIKQMRTKEQLVFTVEPFSLTWPRQFRASPPTVDDVAIYFKGGSLDMKYVEFSNANRGGNVALRCSMDAVDLLVFESELLTGSDMKDCYWGVFSSTRRRQQSSHESLICRNKVAVSIDTALVPIPHICSTDDDLVLLEKIVSPQLSPVLEEQAIDMNVDMVGVDMVGGNDVGTRDVVVSRSGKLVETRFAASSVVIKKNPTFTWSDSKKSARKRLGLNVFEELKNNKEDPGKTPVVSSLSQDVLKEEVKNPEIPNFPPGFSPNTTSKLCGPNENVVGEREQDISKDYMSKSFVKKTVWHANRVRSPSQPWCV